jgi:hypothetical protein
MTYFGAAYAIVAAAFEPPVAEMEPVAHTVAVENFALGVGDKEGEVAAYVAVRTYWLGAAVGGNVEIIDVQSAAAVLFVAVPELIMQSIEQADRKVAVVHLPPEELALGVLCCAEATAGHHNQIQKSPVSVLQDRTGEPDQGLIQAVAT